jgi:glycosyltransferase involved in cell wall biosynthesis
MFDFYSVIERKNPISGILAFSELVRNKAYGDKVHLVVKISNQHADSTGVKLLLETLDMIDPQKVTLIDQVLTRKDILQLINSCDSLISLHRSEGFGLHLAEAMAMGKSVLSTNWSGNVDFMDATNSYPINFDIVPLENDAGSYKKGNFWAEVDVEHAVSQMKKVLENEFSGNEVIKQNAKRQIIETHSIKRVSSMIENRIKIIEYHLGTIRV